LYTTVTQILEVTVKKLLSVFALSILIVSILTAAAPTPDTTFTLVEDLPSTMNVGETYTVIVHVESDQPFLFAQALPSFQFPGKGVVAVQGGDHAGSDTSATLAVTFEAKSSTSNMPGGAAPVHVVVGVRYMGGYVAVQDYLFNVMVP
jgi:hypothetical protein